MQIFITCIQYSGSTKPSLQAFLSEGDAQDHVRSEVQKNVFIDLNLGYDALNVFQQYWWGQRDPLYALLSRRGNSVDWVTVRTSPDEIHRLYKLCEEIISRTEDTWREQEAHHRVATKYLETLKRIDIPESLEELEDWAAENDGPVFSIVTLSVEPQ